MAGRRLWTALALALISAFAGFAADDPHGDSIPEGARLRLGTARMRTTTAGYPNAITPDGKFLVGTTPSGEQGFIDLAGKVSRAVRVSGEFGVVHAVSADGKRAMSSTSVVAYVWDTETGKVLAKVSRRVLSTDNGMSLSADGKLFALGGVKSFNDKDKDKPPTVLVWDVDANKEVASIVAAQSDSIYVALSPNGKRLATWGYHQDRNAKEPPKPETDPNRLVQFWDATDGKETAKARLTAAYNPAAVAFSPDGSVAAASSADGVIHLLDPATGAEKGTLYGRSRQGRRLAFSPDGKTVAAAGDDGSIQRWTVAGGTALGITESPVSLPSSPRGLVFADDGRAITWTLRDSAILVWDTGGKLLTPTDGHISHITGVAVGGGDKEVVTAAANGTIVRWDAATGKVLGTVSLKVPGGFGAGIVTGAIALSPDGTRALATDQVSGAVGIYSLPAGTQLFAVPGNLSRESRSHFTVDGTRMVQTLASYDSRKVPSRTLVWDVVNAKKLAEVEVPGTNSPTAALTPDGKTLLTAGLVQTEQGRDSEFVLTSWDVATGKKLGSYSEPGGLGVPHLVASGDNKAAFVSSPSGGPMVIDFLTGTKVRALELEGRRVAGPPAASPDGKTLAVPLPRSPGQTTTSVALVDFETGKVRKTLGGIAGDTSAIAFSPDGKTLVTGSHDTTALVWDIGGP